MTVRAVVGFALLAGVVWAFDPGDTMRVTIGQSKTSSATAFQARHLVRILGSRYVAAFYHDTVQKAGVPYYKSRCNFSTDFGRLSTWWADTVRVIKPLAEGTEPPVADSELACPTIWCGVWKGNGNVIICGLAGTVTPTGGRGDELTGKRIRVTAIGRLWPDVLQGDWCPLRPTDHCVDVDTADEDECFGPPTMAVSPRQPGPEGDTAAVARVFYVVHNTNPAVDDTLQCREIVWHFC